MFIPIYDANRPVSAPLTTWLLILAAALIFYQQIGEEPAVRMEYFRVYGFYPENYGTWEQFRQYARQYLSSLFIHLDGRHWLAGVWALWTFGRPLERQFGRWLYLAFVSSVICLAYGLEYWRFFGLDIVPENQPLVGFSILGAAAGAAFSVILPHYRLLAFNPLFLIMPVVQSVSAMYFFVAWLVFQLVGKFAGYWPTINGNYSWMTLAIVIGYGLICGIAYRYWLKAKTSTTEA
jgi:membrane associated rhomboid family serine protease